MTQSRPRGCVQAITSSWFQTCSSRIALSCINEVIKVLWQRFWLDLWTKQVVSARACAHQFLPYYSSRIKLIDMGAVQAVFCLNPVQIDTLFIGVGGQEWGWGGGQFGLEAQNLHVTVRKYCFTLPDIIKLILEGGQNFPSGTPHSPPSPIVPICIPIGSFRPQKLEYIIYRITTWHSKVWRTTPPYCAINKQFWIWYNDTELCSLKPFLFSFNFRTIIDSNRSRAFVLQLWHCCPISWAKT